MNPRAILRDFVAPPPTKLVTPLAMNPRAILRDFVAPAFLIGAIIGLVVGLACGLKIGHAKAQQQQQLGVGAAR